MVGHGDEAINFLVNHVDDVANDLLPSLSSNFKRITLVGHNPNERITIDFNLSFYGNESNQTNLHYLAIAELKRERIDNSSPILTIFKKMHIRETGFSKYCIGSALVKPMDKTNTLKPKLLLLQKIENEYLTYTT